MEYITRVIECDGFQVAISIETQSMEEHPSYYPCSALFYVVKGQLNLKVNQQLHTVPRDNFAFVRKYTDGRYFKSWAEDEGGALVYAFALKDEFIRSVIKDFTVDASKEPFIQPIVQLDSNKILRGLFDSIIGYINENEAINKQLVQLKTKEAILGILQANPDYISIFSSFAKAERADLEAFMNHHFNQNIPLQELAKMSGRSLSTFHREFKAIFNSSPHRWIMKRRLYLAREILLTSSRKPSDFYLELGFEDLAHFSRTFKKEFGKSPTAFRKSLE